ncbi:MAG: hypothetical protein CME10_00535 [Gemmatimonadetes bacterium]|jgi:hypothetical protein|nr:hypothetical protein [Gemmatimonadota bacterium]
MINLLPLLLIFFNLLSCGNVTNPSHSEIIEKHHEIIFQQIDPKLDGLVKIDSVSWIPLLPINLPNRMIEIPGIFSVTIQNNSNEVIWIRYDLRFFDDEGFLVDDFIPFGQPVIVAPRIEHALNGDFFVRSANIDQAMRMAMMQFAARIKLQD